MITMQTSNLVSSSISSLSSLKASQGYRNSVNLTPISVSHSKYETTGKLKREITVNLNQIQKLKQILQWRQNTDFPIVKIRSFEILGEKHTFQGKFLRILVQVQSQMKQLNTINKLPIFQAIYVLKESMIGFQRLCHRFGFFKVSAQMIMFNQTQNCKVWLNKDCFTSQVDSNDLKSQRDFVKDLCQVVEENTVKSKISSEIFYKIKNCKYFFEAIGAIETFARTNKIKIPTKLQNLDEIKSPMLKHSITMDSQTIQSKQKNLAVSAKIPHFIKKAQIKKKASFDVHTPLPRKISMATQFCANDRSFTNVSRNHSSNSFLKNESSDNKVEERQDEKFDEDTFLKDMNIRLIEPNGSQSKNIIPSSTYFSSEYLVNCPQSPVSPYGRVSEIDLQQDKRSAFSFNKCVSKQELSTFESAERMFLTVCKSTNGGDFMTPVKKFEAPQSPRGIKTLQYLEGADVQSLEDLQPESPQNNFKPLNINQIREKRKLSGDFGNSTSRNQQEDKVDQELQSFTPKYKTHNLLNVPKRPSDRLSLVKSPSFNVLFKARSRNDMQLEQEEKDQEQRQFLRQTVMNKNGWKGLQILQDKTCLQQSFVDDNIQIPVTQQFKTSELPKLGGMGRQVKNSMINDFEFQLEYGEKLEKEKSIRNQIMNLFD